MLEGQQLKIAVTQMLNFRKIPVGVLSVNCYIVWDTESKSGFAIDPGGDADIICKFLQDEKIDLRGILLTHAHFDHIGGLPELSRQFQVPIWCHAHDADLYHSQENCMEPWFAAVENLPELIQEVPAVLGELGGQILHTPGHTPGGVCYYFPEQKWLFSGDTLFCNGVGRTDFPGGSEIQLWKSIREKLFILPADVRVYPGHECDTTIGAEQR